MAMLATFRDRIASDRIAIGIIRLCVVLLVVTTAIICWRQAGAPYDEMQRRVSEIPTSYAVSVDDTGTPVYFGSPEAPQQFRITNDLNLNVVAEPHLIDDAVQCIKRFKNPSVRVIEYTEPGTTGLFRFSKTIVLFDKESTLDSVFYGMYLPVAVTPDFRSIDRDGRLASCITSGYMKIRNEMNGRIEDAKKEFYMNSAFLLAEALLTEIVFCVALYWVLRGFFGRRGTPSDERH
jgi:hypothetical protein